MDNMQIKALYREAEENEFRGLIKALMVAGGHIGIQNKVSRKRLLAMVRTSPGFERTSDRKLRKALSTLPVGFTSTDGGGYWLPASRQEADQTIGELQSRIDALKDRQRIMNDIALKLERCQDPEQMYLFEV